MVLMDPAEEIRRLVEEEEIPRDEARARVREDLRKRQAVQDRRMSKTKKVGAPINLRWTPGAQKRGNQASRLVTSRKPRT